MFKNSKMAQGIFGSSMPGLHFTLNRSVRYRSVTAWYLILSICLLLVGSTVFAGENLGDLTEMSLEDLMSIEVTSVSKRSEKIADAAAAVFVVSAADIRHAGVQTIPDALRLVPGLHVANIDANTWAVSARGFNGNFANKLLVLIDGRTVYSPVFSGVWWDVQDVVMDDIERIEVIRGPGATLWGANAVNGVINIITRPAGDKPRGVVSAGIGSEDPGLGQFQFEGPVGKVGAVRVYGKYRNQDRFADNHGIPASDDSRVGRGGFRFDSDRTSSGTWTIQGNFYDGEVGASYVVPDLLPPYQQVLNERTAISGGDAMVRYARETDGGNRYTIQAYYDVSERRDAYFSAIAKSLDVEFQHSFEPWAFLDVVWGGGYRIYDDDINSSIYLDFHPSERTYGLVNGFMQFDYHLIPDRFEVTVGSKFEHNEFTAFELQPNVRALWHPTPNQTLWAAVSRAVRTPSRGERDSNIFPLAVPPLSLSNPSPIPVKVLFTGSNESFSESVISYESGFRTGVAEIISLDIVAFYNSYSDLLTGRLGQPTADENYPAYAILPVEITNAREAETYGAEVAASYWGSKSIELQLAYAYLWSEAPAYNLGIGSSLDNWEAAGPRHQFSLFTVAKLPAQMTLSSTVRYVDQIVRQGVDDYLTADVHWSWRMLPHLELGLSGRNLLEKNHEEYISELGRANTQVERRVFASLKWDF